MRRFSLLVLLLALAPQLGCEEKPLLPGFRFDYPKEGQLSLAGNVPVALKVPLGDAKIWSLVVTLDGEDVTGLFDNFTAELPSPAGPHELVATFETGGKSQTITRRYETILVMAPAECNGLTDQECFDLNAAVAEDCEIFNARNCLMPWPSSKHLAPADTPTGFRPVLSPRAIPEVNGTPVPPSMLTEATDGFSPTVQILTHFPGRVDVVASGLSRLLPPCLDPPPPDEDPECTPTTGPPFVEVRTSDARSLDADHPTVIMDLNGHRILHWTETIGAGRVLILRPGESLQPGQTYIVGLRRLVAVDGTPIEAEPAFAALRDGRPTDIPQLVARKSEMELVFKRLEKAGVPRDDLVLAFQFTVASDHALTHQMLAMRDQGLAWLDEQTEPNFTVLDDGTATQNDCTDPGDAVWKVVSGVFTVPLFLEQAPYTPAPPNDDNVAQHTVDANDVPVQNGTWDAVPFDVSIPCLLHPEHGDPTAPVHTLLLGHGIFGNGRGMVRGIPPGAAALMDYFRSPPAASGIPPRDTRRWNYVAGATDWTGWSNRDFLWVGTQIIGFGNSQLASFPAFPDRHRQGQLNTLILSRMLKRGLFNADPAFQDAEGHGLLPVVEGNPSLGHYYYGISMGGVQGLFHAAISPDIDRFGIDVGSMNFSFLLQRSTQFSNPDNPFDFRFILDSIGLTSNIDLTTGIGLLHEIWVSADPAGYMTRLAQELAPGAPNRKFVYLSPAWLDYQVTNHGTEATARTLGLPSGPGSLQKGLVGIPDAPDGTPLPSALVMWDTGLHDILDPDPVAQSHIPPLRPDVVPDPAGDPHGARPFIPATIQTLMQFLQPGGEIENFCDDDGLCNASQPWECEPDDIDPVLGVVPGCS